ncbi:MAG TPA: DUF5335 family protein [Vicinamibacterales bacterium]|nr:DUF5335 family protein [Vicinamibacterales bacterium]
MKSQVIPLSQWRQYLDSFSRQYDGWLVSMEVDSPEIGAQPEIDNLPLEGISADTVSTRDATIGIVAGRVTDGRLTHTIVHATGLAVEETESGVKVALQVTAADGTTTILRFRSPSRPETVDGVVRAGSRE